MPKISSIKCAFHIYVVHQHIYFWSRPCRDLLLAGKYENIAQSLHNVARNGQQHRLG